MNTRQEKQMSAPLRAALLMLASTMAFGLMAVTIRLATAHVPTPSRVPNPLTLSTAHHLACPYFTAGREFPTK